MKNKLMGVITLTIMMMFVSSDKITAQNTSDDYLKNVTGHLTMRLIDFKIIDSTFADKDMADMIVGMMKPNFELELIFNANRSSELIKEGEELRRRNLFDRETNIAYEFLYTDSVNYYSEMIIEEMMAGIETTEEQLKEIDKMISMNPYETTKKEILGFKCAEVFMMAPPDYTNVYMTAYTTDKVPHISEAVGPMRKYFSGAPIRTTMTIEGIEITFGAIEYNEASEMAKYLELDFSDFEKLTFEELDAIKE